MISTRVLRVVYRPPGIEAVKEVSVEIPENKVTCIIGPNASGKTSILRAIAALVEYEGSVLVDGKEAKNATRLLRKILSYTPNLGVAEDYLGARVFNVLLYSRYPVSTGFADTEKDVEEVYRVARLLNIEHLLDRKLGELSSGELQRVVLACALTRNPRIVLLDEPDSHLDASYKSRLSSFLRELSSRVTVVLTTHDTVFATSTCDYVIVVSEGHVIYAGPVEKLLENPGYLERAYDACFAVASAVDRKVLVPVYGATSKCTSFLKTSTT